MVVLFEQSLLNYERKAVSPFSSMKHKVQVKMDRVRRRLLGNIQLVNVV